LAQAIWRRLLWSTGGLYLLPGRRRSSSAAPEAMQPALPTLLLLLGLETVAEAAGGRGGALRQHGPIDPKLDPQSDKTFFGEDYPHDLHPRARIKFNHPYPIVQDSSDYDRDYVKDENSDDGEWKAQMEYDLIRTKMSKEREEYDRAKEEERRWAKELEAAKKREADAEAAADEADRRAQAAREASRKAEERAKELGKKAGEGSKTSEDEKVQEAVKEVQKEMDDLSNCQKELAEARARLKEALAKQEQYEKEHAVEEKAKSEARRQAERETEKKAEEAEAEAHTAESEITRTRKEDEARHKKTEEEKVQYQEAEREYEHEVKDMENLEADIQKAAERLRKFRRSEDADGGVYNTKGESTEGASNVNMLRSGALAPKAGALLLPLVAAVASNLAGLLD